MPENPDCKTETREPSPHPSPLAKWLGSWGLLVLILLVMGFVRVRLLDFPLERDEGEYAYAGQLMRRGVPPYQECYNMKWPGTYAAYAVIMAVFGETPTGIHLGLLIVSIASAVMMFLIGRRIGGNGMGLAAAGMQAFLAMNPSTLGFAAHANHFVVLAALIGIWLLLPTQRGTSLWRCLVAGIFFGVATIMKQPGAVFGIFAFVWLACREWREGGLRGAATPNRAPLRLLMLIVGGLLPLLAMAGTLAALGVWGKFWHWTVEYARLYAGILTVSQGLPMLVTAIKILWTAASGLWMLAGLGFVLIWCEPTLRQWRGFLMLFALFSFVGVCPGFFFREHYFLLFLPAASLFCGAAICIVSKPSSRWLAQKAVGAQSSPPQTGREARIASLLAGGLFTLAAAQSLLISYDFFFLRAHDQSCHKIYGITAFPVAMDIGRYIEARTPPDARIAIIGSEPEIYFYSHRRAATGYIYMYPLMEPQSFAADMQRDMIHGIEQAAPDYLVFVAIPNSWLAHENSDMSLLDWTQRYTAASMQIDALVDCFPDGHSEPHWNLAGRNLAPRSQYFISIFRKKTDDRKP